MADQALDMLYYDASVVFYEFCIERLKQDESLNVKEVAIFKKTHLSSITSKKAKVLLEKAIKKHDHMLEDLGQMGRIHRCRSQPFRQNPSKSRKLSSSNAMASIPFQNNFQSYLNSSIPMTKNLPFDENHANMFDLLCRGGKQKVTKKVYIYFKTINKRLI